VSNFRAASYPNGRRTAISSSGQIIGFAANKNNGETQGYLLTPI
jgi:hypothetical protein